MILAHDLNEPDFRLSLLSVILGSKLAVRHTDILRDLSINDDARFVLIGQVNALAWIGLKVQQRYIAL